TTDQADIFANSGDPALGTTIGQTASADGSFVSLDDMGTGTSTTPGGRDLSTPLTATKLLGAWDVIAGADRCRLNLTQTIKTGTKRYRASTPGCAIAPLARVASWQLAGTQVQLYDDAGAIIGSLLLSGNRFLGTLSGGIAVSMAG
ncbi:MAG: protease inhibitor Inh/omp19 family protein, partial [Alphaproteobacteria bacterium]|nr:protease inhibitor Inh/omp19 family protein [Alphaproteobacteria bacterium]